MTGQSCKGCLAPLKGHPNKRFCTPKCKDTFHNWSNPRGKFRHLKMTQEEADALDKEAMHREAMDAQEASESPGGFFG